VANVRAALGNIAHELARHHAGTMSDAEERATFSPICENKAAFEKFFQHPLRSNLYSGTGRRALPVSSHSPAPMRCGNTALNPALIPRATC
jgi:hypothetical protein